MYVSRKRNHWGGGGGGGGFLTSGGKVAITVEIYTTDREFGFLLNGLRGSHQSQTNRQQTTYTQHTHTYTHMHTHTLLMSCFFLVVRSNSCWLTDCIMFWEKSLLALASSSTCVRRDSHEVKWVPDQNRLQGGACAVIPVMPSISRLKLIV